MALGPLPEDDDLIGIPLLMMDQTLDDPLPNNELNRSRSRANLMGRLLGRVLVIAAVGIQSIGSIELFVRRKQKGADGLMDHWVLHLALASLTTVICGMLPDR